MNQTKNTTSQYKQRQRYTALWAFSESIFGGILHAFKIPFTGLFLGGFAVIFLTMISDISQTKKDILKVTSVVLVIKFMLSPNTPFTAYFAVFAQGVFAFLVFSLFKNRSIAIFALSFLSALWSASQKIIVTTLIFGMNFWYSIDEFTIYLAKIVGLNIDKDFSMSFVLITAYFLLHFLGAILFARIAIRLPEFLKKNEEKVDLILEELKVFQETNFQNENSIKNSKKKKWYKKPSRVILLIFLIVIAFITYINPELNKIRFVDVVSMLVRAVILIYVWFKIISPTLVKLFLKILKRNSNFDYINGFTLFFPEFKRIILYSWNSTSKQPKFIRIKKFIEISLLLLLR